MLVDFSNINFAEQPTLTLKTLDGIEIQTLGYIYNLKGVLAYNEVSEISFDIPAAVEGRPVPMYDEVVGMRIVDLEGYGQFILTNPSITKDGIKEIKSCKAYSLEYELTFKKMYLKGSTYNFYNPHSDSNTILKMIIDESPGWSIGYVSPTLYGKYRTFDDLSDNLYNFIKSSIQSVYGCVFVFDTYEREISVYDVNDDIPCQPIYISLDNLVREIKIDEDTDNIFTVLDVSGADGVDIRRVNPLGNNKIYNLNYFVNNKIFNPELAESWREWQAKCDSYRKQFYNKTVEQSIQTSRLLSEKVILNDLKAELASLENIQSVRIESSVDAGSTSGLADIKTQIENKKSAIAQQEAVIAGVEAVLADLGEDIIAIRDELSFESNFTPAELAALKKYFKEDAIQDPTFVWDTVGAYSSRSTNGTLTTASLQFSDASVKTVETESTGSTVYEITGGTVSATVNETVGTINRQTVLTAKVIRANIEQTAGGKSIVSIVMSDGVYGAMSFPEGCVSLIADSLAIDHEPLPEDWQLRREFGGSALPQNPYTLHKRYTFNSQTGRVTLHEPRTGLMADLVREGYHYYYGTAIYYDYDEVSGTARGYSSVDAIYDASFDFTTYRAYEPATPFTESLAAFAAGGSFYITADTTEYEKYSVAWDLYNYATDTLRKISEPTYTFSVDSANFLTLNEFRQFAQRLAVGRRVYLDLDGKIINPILIGMEFDWEDWRELTLTFSNSYTTSDSSFRLADLLEKGITMGKKLDFSQYSYAAFVDSGASSSVKDFMESALDVAKNSILSSSEQAVSWDSSGLHLRKWLGDRYDDSQIRMINNSIVFTRDNWASAVMAIGAFHDTNKGDCWGIVAPNITGTLLAGENLVIQAKNGSNEVLFQVDGDGAKLLNADFNILQNGKQILLNPLHGIAIGSAPLLVNGQIDTNNAKMWLDTDGDIHLKGVEAVSGTFDGTVKVRELYIGEDNIALQISALNSEGKIKNGLLDLGNITLDGVTGDITMTGNINLSGASQIIWSAATAPVKYQFSANGTSEWHSTMASTDKYRRDSLDGGTTWGAAYQFKGEDGSDGAPGSDADVPDWVKEVEEIYVTTISEQCIKTPTLYATNMYGGEIRGTNIYGGAFWDEDGDTKLVLDPLGGGIGDLALYRGSNVVFSILDTMTGVYLKSNGYNFMSVNAASGTNGGVSLNGVWDFSNATTVGITSVFA